MSEAQVPDGFERHFRRSGLTDPWEPLYSRKLDDRVQMGLFLSEQHCNSRGLVHGGLIAALADNAMGLSCVVALAAAGRDPGKGLVTVSLGTDYLGSAKLGAWLEIDPEPVKVGGSICFARAIIRGNETPVAMANATFKIL
ncbi:MAG: PaaI family thioesterase [Hyphomonadaceae bacterium]|nr:PaaI family thioesterase [Hyphomonadaceae bacterium]